MSVQELRGQISVLLRRAELMERQGLERETEILRLQQEVRQACQRSGELLDQVPPPTKREQRIIAHINSLAARAERLHRELQRNRTAPELRDETSDGGNRRGALSPRPTVRLVGPQAPAVLFGASWLPERAEPGEPLRLQIQAPGFPDHEDVAIEVLDEADEPYALMDAAVRDELVVVAWSAPMRPGRFRFRAAGGSQSVMSGWLDVAMPAVDAVDAVA